MSFFRTLDRSLEDAFYFWLSLSWAFSFEVLPYCWGTNSLKGCHCYFSFWFAELPVLANIYWGVLDSCHEGAWSLKGLWLKGLAPGLSSVGVQPNTSTALALTLPTCWLLPCCVKVRVAVQIWDHDSCDPRLHEDIHIKTPCKEILLPFCSIQDKFLNAHPCTVTLLFDMRSLCAYHKCWVSSRACGFRHQ